MKPSAYKSTLFAIAILTTAAGACFAQNIDSPATHEEFAAPAGFTQNIREIDDVKLHYVIGGDGPLVLLVHGFAQTWYEWRDVMPELAKTHTVIAVDLPALGQSGPTDSYAGHDVAKILHKFAKSFSPEKPFDLVAHDIGIWNTYPMVVQNQSDIRRLVYMEAPIPDDTLYSWPALTPDGPSLAWHLPFFSLTAPIPETMIAGNEEMFLSDFILTRAANKDAFPKSVLELYAKSWAKPESLSASLDYYRELPAMAAHNKTLSETKLTMPVLAIGGGNSMGSYVGDQMQNYATDVRAETMPGCGQWLPEECTTELNALLVSFLAAK